MSVSSTENSSQPKFVIFPRVEVVEVGKNAQQSASPKHHVASKWTKVRKVGKRRSTQETAEALLVQSSLSSVSPGQSNATVATTSSTTLMPNATYDDSEAVHSMKNSETMSASGNNQVNTTGDHTGATSSMTGSSKAVSGTSETASEMNETTGGTSGSSEIMSRTSGSSEIASGTSGSSQTVSKTSEAASGTSGSIEITSGMNGSSETASGTSGSIEIASGTSESSETTSGTSETTSGVCAGAALIAAEKETSPELLESEPLETMTKLTKAEIIEALQINPSLLSNVNIEFIISVLLENWDKLQPLFNHKEPIVVKVKGNEEMTTRAYREFATEMAPKLNHAFTALKEWSFNSVQDAHLIFNIITCSYVSGLCVHLKETCPRRLKGTCTGTDTLTTTYMECHTCDHHAKKHDGQDSREKCQWKLTLRETEKGVFKIGKVSDFLKHGCQCIGKPGHFTPVEVKHQKGLKESTRVEMMGLMNQNSVSEKTIRKQKIDYWLLQTKSCH